MLESLSIITMAWEKECPSGLSPLGLFLVPATGALGLGMAIEGDLRK